MNFVYPKLLWLLLVVPPTLWFFLWWAGRRRQRLLTGFIQARLLPDLTVGISRERELVKGILLTMASAAVLVALARPQWGFTLEETRVRGLHIIVAVDTSKSMLAEDVAPNRLARAKLTAIDLMQTAKSDRLGLVAFAGGAFLQCPMTIDDAAFRQSVEMLDVNTLPQGGTAIAEAIETAKAAFKEGDGHKVLVLITDGEDQDSNAVEAARKAAEAGMKIFTIGIGSTDGELLPLRDAKGRTDYLKDDAGNAVKSRLNETLLQEIATAGHGFYLPMRGAKVIETLYQNGLAPLPKSESDAKTFKHYHEQYHWPLALAIGLLLAEILLPARARTRPLNVTAEKKAAAITVMILLLCPGLGIASPRSAMKDFQAGRFDQAQKGFERLMAADQKGDFRLAFNAGTAAYRGTNYAAAINHFTAVLAAKDLKLQQSAYFNLGNCHFRLGEDAKDLDAMQEKWETAIKFFQNAVTLDKTDPDAAYNLEFAKKCVEQIVALREAAKRAKAAADSATRQRNYHQAYQIMEQLLQTNPTAKQFEDFVKKLKDIDDIATPQHP